MVTMLLECCPYEFDINARIPKIRGTYLTYAASVCDSEMIQLLFCYGADPKILDTVDLLRLILEKEKPYFLFNRKK